MDTIVCHKVMIISKSKCRNESDGEAEGSAEAGSIRRRRTGVRSALVGGMTAGERAQPMMAQEGSAQIPGSWSRRGSAAIAGVVVLQALFTYAPFMQQIFGSESLPLWVWKWLLLGGVVFFIVVELEKLLVRLIYPQVKPA